MRLRGFRKNGVLLERFYGGQVCKPRKPLLATHWLMLRLLVYSLVQPTSDTRQADTIDLTNP
jgi:hypothetical protein